MDGAALLLTTAAMPADGPAVGPFGPRVLGPPMPVPPNVLGPRPRSFGPGTGWPLAPGIPGRVVVVIVNPGWACKSSGDRYRNSPLVIGSLYFLRRNFSRSSTSTLG